MPLYEYKCPACDSAWEMVRSVDERNALVLCRCGADMERQPSAAAMNFRTAGGVSYKWTLPNGTHNTPRKLKTIGKGSIGGRRKNPSIQRHADGRVSVEIKR